jgi:hypothetical protein
MLVFPAATPVAMPALFTVATVLSVEDQVTLLLYVLLAAIAVRSRCSELLSAVNEDGLPSWCYRNRNQCGTYR